MKGGMSIKEFLDLGREGEREEKKENRRWM